MNYWMIKTEPGCYSIDDLARDKQTEWDGVRNYQARNFMRDQMKVGDLVLVYHSNIDLKGIYGIAKVSSTPHPDESAFDPNNKHFDPKSSLKNPAWILVDIAFVKKFTHPITLREIKEDPEFHEMEVVRRGSRLSVHPVAKKDFKKILTLRA